MARVPRPPRHVPRSRMVDPRSGRMTPDWERYWYRVILPQLDQLLDKGDWTPALLAALNKGDFDARLSDVEALALQLFASLNDRGFTARIEDLEDTTEDLEASKWTRTDADGHLESVDIVCHNDAVVCHNDSVVYL